MSDSGYFGFVPFVRQFIDQNCPVSPQQTLYGTLVVSPGLAFLAILLVVLLDEAYNQFASPLGNIDGNFALS